MTVTASSDGDTAQSTATDSFTLTVKHPCQDPSFSPSQISASPTQQNPVPYLYTEQAARIEVESFVVEPELCPIIYECIEVFGPTSPSALQCDDLTIESSQVLTLKTLDKETYGPGDYEIKIRGSTDTARKIESEVILTLSLVDPCPTATLSGLSSSFDDVLYQLGGEEIL